MKKYARTYHLPLSPGATSDDKIMDSLNGLRDRMLIITEKMDGENTTIHAGGSHARSPDSRYHPSRDWLKAFAAGISHRLSPGERIVGENVFARHSIAYDALPSYFLGFAWIVEGVVRSWSDTLDRFVALGVTPVPTLHHGPYRDGLFEQIAGSLDAERQEGFVARVEDSFLETEMPSRMGKYVRAGHVQSDTHWMHAEVIPNKLG